MKLVPGVSTMVGRQGQLSGTRGLTKPLISHDWWTDRGKLTALLSVPSLAGVDLAFLLAAHTVLCFVVVARAVMVTQ